ncbi:MAG: helix-turn-helix domain-containing protein [Acidimicrobiales bacterium]
MANDAVEIARARELIRSGRAQAIRERAGLSRLEMARSAGVDDSTIARWESGERSPRGEAAKRYARLLRELSEAVPL